MFRCVVIFYWQLSETHLMKSKYIGIFRCIVTLYGQMAEACRLNWTCIGWACTCMLCCVVIFFLLIQQILILTFCYYFYGFLRELNLAFSRSPDRGEAHPFHGQTRWALLNDLAPDIHDAMELWALEPHVVLVKVISVCGLHVFFHQYVADLRERKSENDENSFCITPYV